MRNPTSELEELRAELRDREAEVAKQKRQLQSYAADLRETFELERLYAKQLRDSYVATVGALANAVEARDAYTGRHAERAAAFAMLIAREHGTTLAEDPQLEFGFLLHDIGKVAVPDAILFKTAPLNQGERALIEQHVTVGWEILRGVEWLSEAKLVVRHHHERFDGGRGTRTDSPGMRFPLAARIFAVADTLDALTTDRPYRPGEDPRGRPGDRRRARRHPVRPRGPSTRSRASTTPRWKPCGGSSPEPPHRLPQRFPRPVHELDRLLQALGDPGLVGVHLRLVLQGRTGVTRIDWCWQNFRIPPLPCRVPMPLAFAPPIGSSSAR